MDRNLEKSLRQITTVKPVEVSPISKKKLQFEVKADFSPELA